MTSIELFIEELKELKLIREDLKTTLSLLIGKYKEMHKQEMFEYWQGGINCTEEGGKSFDQYYQETFVSKGSDDTLKNYHIVESTEKVEDDVEKLAEEFYNKENIFSELKGLLVSAKKFGFIDGYNKAKETLYTEEQVRESIKKATTRKYNSHLYNAEEIIQSLKQPKTY